MHIVSKEIASTLVDLVLFFIFKFSHEINLFQLDQKVFICVYRINFPILKFYTLFRVNFLYWGVIFPSICVNLSHINFRYLN